MIVTLLSYLKILDLKKNNGGEMGFEPRKELPLAGFQDRCFQPLSHLSVLELFIIKNI